MNFRKYFVLLLLTIIYQGITLAQVSPEPAQNTQEKISVEFKNQSLSVALKKIEELSGFTIEFNHAEISPYKVTVNIKNKSLDESLKMLLKDKPLSTARVVGTKNIRILRDEDTPLAAGRRVRGRVVDRDGLPLIGASIKCFYNQGSSKESVDAKHTEITDLEGYFNYALPGNISNPIFSTSYIGMVSTQMKYTGQEDFVIVMDEDKINELTGVVVEAGIIQRDKSGFTGAYTTVTQEQLKSVASINVLQSLKSLDPSFIISDNILSGSNPNEMANIEIRGGTSMNISSSQSQATSAPNAPLFILDGFEASLSQVNDLNVNRIQSFTLLKDAGSTAIYGSKGANGVVVIETIKPKAGEFMVRYNNTTKLSFPDLGVYNMMNSSEKIEFERLAERWGKIDDQTNITGQNIYYERLAAVKRGVDTYWLKEPVRNSITQDHSFSVSGGEKHLLFDVGVNYRDEQGVMKDSKRESFGGNVKLLYRNPSGLNISNNATFSGYNGHDGSWGSFARFVEASPYFTKYDEQGRVTQVLDTGLKQSATSTSAEVREIAYNPLYNALLDSRKDDKSYTISNKTNIDWHIADNLRLSGALNLERTNRRIESFQDPRNTKFLKEDYTKRGEYTSTNVNSWLVSANTSASYNKSFNNAHNFTVIGRLSLQQNSSKEESIIAVGFPESSAGLPSSAYSYKEGTRPAYYENIRREVSSLIVFNYNYKLRYLFDFNYNLDGANTFGRNKKFTDFWSVGLGWNLEREAFAKDWDWLSALKISGTKGTNANQQMNVLSHAVYAYYIGNTQFGTGSYLEQFANPDLKWQKVDKTSLNIDGSVLNKRLNFLIGLYSNKTDPMVVTLNQKPSSGVSNYPFNMGHMTAKGIDFTIQYYPIFNTKENILLSIRLTGAYGKETYAGFSSKLNDLNADSVEEELSGKLLSLQKFENGRSPRDIWAVKSLGIDPATGKEIYLTKDGSQTFIYDINDRVVVGNSKPDIEGTLGINLTYKKLQVSTYLRYRLGGDAFNTALFNKVENISEGRIVYNQDKRALYDRWQKPGDISQFRSIAMRADGTEVSSRFVQRDNQLIGESIKVTWDFANDFWIKTVKLKDLRIGVSMEDVFRLTSMKVEKGIDYPFARAVSFELSARF